MAPNAGARVLASGSRVSLRAGVIALRTRALEHQLFGVAPLDARTVMRSALLFGIASLAVWIPARQAARWDAQTAVKAE